MDEKREEDDQPTEKKRKTDRRKKKRERFTNLSKAAQKRKDHGVGARSGAHARETLPIGMFTVYFFGLNVYLISLDTRLDYSRVFMIY